MGRHRAHWWTRRRIARFFIETETTRVRARLFHTLDNCDRCADTFRRFQKLESALCNTDAPYTHLSIERVGAALLDTREDETSTAPAAPRGRRLRRLPILAAVGAAGAALVAVMLVLMSPVGPTNHRRPLSGGVPLEEVQLTVKGVHPTAAAALIGVRLLEVSPKRSDIRETENLTIDDTITFTYTQAETKSAYLALFGLQERGEVRWYYPDYGERQSIPIQGNRVDEPLGDGIDLSINHRPGWLRVVALFSDIPIDVAHIEAAVNALRNHPDELKALTPLSIDDVSNRLRQYTMMVKIEKGDDGGNHR